MSLAKFNYLVSGLVALATTATPLKSAEPVHFTYGQTIIANIPGTGDDIRYTFDAQAGDPIRVSVGDGILNNSLEVWGYVFDPVGHLVASGGGYDVVVLTLVASNAGQYTIVVADGGGNAAGNVAVSISESEIRVPIIVNFSASSSVLQQEGGTVDFSTVVRDTNGVAQVWVALQEFGGDVVITNLSLTAGNSRFGTWQVRYSFPTNFSSTTQVYTARVFALNFMEKSTNGLALPIQVLNYFWDKLQIERAVYVQWTAIENRSYQLGIQGADGEFRSPGPIVKIFPGGPTNQFFDGASRETVAVKEVLNPSIGTFRLTSDACAGFYRDGTNFMYKCGYALNGGRGFNIGVLDRNTLEVVDLKSYDTWISYAAWNDVADYIDAIPDGRLVLIATGDDIGRYAYGLAPNVEQVFQRLETLGSRQIRNYYFRDSFALVAIKGMTNALAEDFRQGYGVSLEWRFSPPPYLNIDYQSAPAAKLSWHSLPGSVYHPQESADCRNWIELGEEMSGTGDILTRYRLFPTQSTPRLFFKLQVER